MNNKKENWEKALLEYRKEQFKVKVEPVRNPMNAGEIALSVTHNGFQWNTITLLPHEVKAVVAALSKNGKA